MTRNNIFLIGFIVLKFALQFILLSPEYELQRDEFLHWIRPTTWHGDIYPSPQLLPGFPLL